MKPVTANTSGWVELHAGNNLARIVHNGNLILSDAPGTSTNATVTNGLSVFLPVGKATYVQASGANVTIQVIE